MLDLRRLLSQRWEVAALGDGNMRNLRNGDVIQLERKGYFIVDRPLISAGKPLVRLLALHQTMVLTLS